MKQAVIKHMEQYRDKTLSFGCEVVDVANGRNLFVVNRSVGGDVFCTYGTLSSGEYRIQEDRLKIIGHPLTHADLLRALEARYEDGGTEENYILDTVGQLWELGEIEGETFHDNTVVANITLTYRTIEDIPEDNPMWKQLAQLLNIKII